MGRPSKTPARMNTPFPDDTLAAIKQAIYSGRKIEAIKLYREATGSQLIDAKNAIDRLDAELRSTSPEQFTTKSRAGCLTLVALFVVVMRITIWCVAR